jgi:hypothetical protein
LGPYLKKIWSLIKKKIRPYHLGALGNCLSCLALEPGLVQCFSPFKRWFGLVKGERDKREREREERGERKIREK